MRFRVQVSMEKKRHTGYIKKRITLKGTEKILEINCIPSDFYLEPSYRATVPSAQTRKKVSAQTLSKHGKRS